MSTKTCTDCRHSIPAGKAVIRSQSFQLVAYCQPCARDRGIAPAQHWAPTLVPTRAA